MERYLGDASICRKKRKWVRSTGRRPSKSTSDALITPLVPLAFSLARWFEAVLDVLINSSSDTINPDEEGMSAVDLKILPETDWRWSWVESTLRRLEDGVARSHHRLSSSPPSSTSDTPEDPPFPPPPPPTHPLHPRTRAAAFLHGHLHNPHAISSYSSSPSPSETSSRSACIDGPPYQLLILDLDEPNAFSYGFGGSGAAGIVVYRGILDSILSSPPSPSTPLSSPSHPSPPSPPPTPLSNTPTRRSLLSYFIPSPTSSLSSPPPKPPPHPIPPTRPTEAQSLHLATILAHEMSHLLLSHHLESLSHTSVVLPSLANLGLDLLRVFTFPLTVSFLPPLLSTFATDGILFLLSHLSQMMFGPFVNDAIAAYTKPADGSKMGDSRSSQKLEIEADIVGLRYVSFPITQVRLGDSQ